jgi:hypothetical protein
MAPRPQFVSLRRYCTLLQGAGTVQFVWMKVEMREIRPLTCKRNGREEDLRSHPDSSKTRSEGIDQLNLRQALGRAAAGFYRALMRQYRVLVRALRHLFSGLVVVLFVTGRSGTMCVGCMFMLFSGSCVTIVWHICTSLRSIRFVRDKMPGSAPASIVRTLRYA